MRICIVGAGAIGGIVGAWLVRAGNDVTFIARGETLARLRSEGLRLVSPDGREERIAGVRATEAWVADRPYDAVLLAVKAHQLREVAERLPPLIGPDTLVVPMQNGLPFWYFADRNVRCVDPDGAIQRAIDPRGVIGCVVYIACERVDPAAVKHLSGNRFLIGELDGSRTPRVERLAKTLSDAGFEAPVLDDIRGEVWVKLWGNVAFNPVSALTGATLAEICGDIHARALVRDDAHPARQAHRGRGPRGPAQDLDVAGCRSGTAAGGRCARGRGGGAGRDGRRARAHHPRDLPGGKAPRPHARRCSGKSLPPMSWSAPAPQTRGSGSCA
jgi:2-dehydropantoate 2-reductase